MADVQFAVSTLTAGQHSWNARVKDNQGRWSHTYTRSFMVLPRDTISHLAGLEWFWDTDPGYGNGNMISLEGSLDTVSWNSDLGNLSPGIHDLYVRVRNRAGIWSHTVQRNTYLRAEPNAMIEKLIYFYRNPNDTSETFTYTLNQPQHHVELTFEPDAGDLIDGQSYEFCITAVRTDSVKSFERCQTIIWSGPVSIDEEEIQSRIALFPNPNKGVFEVKLPDELVGQAYIQLFDVNGKSVEFNRTNPSNPFVMRIGMKHPIPGVYFMLVEIKSKVFVQRLMVK